MCGAISSSSSHFLFFPLTCQANAFILLLVHPVVNSKDGFSWLKIVSLFLSVTYNM